MKPNRISSRLDRHRRIGAARRVPAALCALSLLAGASSVLTAAPSQAQSPTSGTVSEEIRRTLEPIRAKYGIPALGGGFVVGNSVLEYAVTGERAAGSGVVATDSDVFHLGSITKSMTGTVVGILVERGQLRWNATVNELFPDFTVNAGYQGATLQMFMSHRGGVPAATYPPGGPAVKLDGSPVTPEERRAYAANILNRAPSSPPGTRYEYANAGTVLVAYAAERATGKTFEQLVRELVWQPLGMTSCSLGTLWGSVTEQPAPHRWVGGVAKTQANGVGNSRIIDGADQSRCSVADVLKYTRAHATMPTATMSSASWSSLHTPLFPGDGYAAGWLLSRASTGETVYSHAGSNTMNYANISYFTEKGGAGVVVAMNIGVDSDTNQMGAKTTAAFQEANAALSALALARQAAVLAAPTTTAPATTTAPTTTQTAPTTAAVATTAPKVTKTTKCTVSKKTRKKTCR